MLIPWKGTCFSAEHWRASHGFLVHAENWFANIYLVVCIFVYQFLFGAVTVMVEHTLMLEVNFMVDAGVCIVLCVGCWAEKLDTICSCMGSKEWDSEQTGKKGPDLKSVSKIGSHGLEDKSNAAERRMTFSFVAWKTSWMKDMWLSPQVFLHLRVWCQIQACHLKDV